MQQVKIFKSIESEVSNLGENVNVTNIFGNIAPQSPSTPGMGNF